MAKKKLTIMTLKGLQPAPDGKQVMVWDTVVESFGVRVTDTGSASFIVMRRIDGKLTRLKVGGFKLGQFDDKELGATLSEAREKARAALADMRRGIDPREKEAADRRERETKRANGFSAVARDFLAEHVSTLRSEKEIKAHIELLMARWGDLPIVDIERRDVAAAVREVATKYPAAARKRFAYVSSLFSWAVGQERYGLKISPTFGMKSAMLGARVAIRDRVLTDDEMRLFWRATAKTEYPFGPLFRFLLLTGQRRDEAACMPWPEIDLDKKLWEIPSVRMKAESAHAVPLSPQAVELLKSLPRFKGKERKGDFAFTTTAGEKAVSGFSKAKARLDAEMLKIAREDAQKQGDDPAKVKLVPWRLHDLRRTARTHFSALPSADIVRELAIGHRQQGLHRVYDQHAYLDERRALLDAWARRLMAIIEPPKKPGNVIDFASAANAS